MLVQYLTSRGHSTGVMHLNDTVQLGRREVCPSETTQIYLGSAMALE